MTTPAARRHLPNRHTKAVARDWQIGVAIKSLPPHCYILLSILSIQLGAALAVRLFPLLGPVGTVQLRIGFAALLLAAARRPRFTFELRRHAAMLLLYGALIGAMNLCFYQAISRLPLGVAVTIEFTGPLAVAVATSRRLLDFLWIGLAFSGLFAMTPDLGTGLDPTGVAYALLAASGWAGFIIVSRRIGHTVPGHSGLAIAMAVAALVVMPFAVASGDLARMSPLLVLAGAAVAVLATAIPLSLEFAALQRLPARVYGILVTLEPAVATLIGIALLGQSVNPLAALALVCVTAAALGMALTTRTL